MFAPIFCFLVVAAAANSISLEDCPRELIRDKSLQVFGDSCFQFKLNERRSYQYAETQCETHGGTLALVKSEDINDFIVRHIVYTFGKMTKVWIGLNDRDKENTFVWEDGTRLAYGYSNWGYQEGPRNGFFQHNLEDCVVLDPDGGQWHDQHCKNVMFGLISNNDFAYVCEYKVQAKTSKAPPSTTVGEEIPPTTTVNVESIQQRSQ